MPLDPITGGAIIGAAGNILGGLFGDSSAKKAAARAAAANERQLKNQHQWEVEDLRKAGLNPILSGTGGGGSGTISTPVADTGNTGRAISRTAGDIAQLKLMNSQAENLDSQTRKINLDYRFDQYFRPLERMQSLTSGRVGMKATMANTINATAQLNNLREDLRGKKISNDEAARLLARKLQDPEFANYMDSASYAERKELGKILTGDMDAEDGINLVLRVLGR